MSLEYLEFAGEDWKKAVHEYIFKTLNNELNLTSDPIHLVLSGGNTPLPVYETFCKMNLNWKRIHIWLADERIVPKSSDERNGKVIEKALGLEVTRLANLHHYTEAEPNDVANDYAQQLNGVPNFVLSVLGIGEDGHTASLFPGNDLGDDLGSQDTCAIFNSPKPPKERVSLSMKRINMSKSVLFLVAGESKRDVIRRIRKGDSLPATMVKGIDKTAIYFELGEKKI